MLSSQQWTLTLALRPFLSQTVAIAYALYILAYPPRHRYPAFLLLCVPVSYAFIYHLSFTPWYSLNDTFGRMLYIWLAYMSYAFLLVRVTPPSKQEFGWRERLRWAGKVLYTRHLGEYVVSPLQESVRKDVKGEELQSIRAPTCEATVLLRRRREPDHHLSRFEFCLRHLIKAALFIALNCIVDMYVQPPSLYPPASFVRRLPSSLSVNELKVRVMMTWDVCIADMLWFDSIYSVFAILWVGVFRLDSASEWSRSLFGPLTQAYSVRRYWGVYWHDFIHSSFAGHAKIVARDFLGLTRGRVLTRLVENVMVFVISGLFHSLVGYVQTEGKGEAWVETMWYGGQMLPVAIEGMMQHIWYKSGLRNRLLALIGERMLLVLERVVGHTWVLSWMFWSVPKYLLTTHALELEKLRRT